MEFKDKLKSLRKEKGISQQVLANSIYVSRSAVAKWENGLGFPSEESMDALIKYFGVPKEYFATDDPEDVLIKKNKLIRKIGTVLLVSVAILGVLLLLLVMSIPLVNDLTAAQIKNRLESLPLPEDSVRIQSLSNAGKVVGNGNGMQYLGAILIQSDLPIDEVENHYSQYRVDQWDCLVMEYHGGRLKFVDRGGLRFSAELDSSKTYYVVYSWGSGLDFYEELDLRGH